MDLDNINNILFSDNCKHTMRNCKIISPCCDKIYHCRLCHDDKMYNNNDDDKIKHNLISKNLKQIICKNCNFMQDSKQHCENCGICFGKYYCKICNIFDDEKDIFHCDKCGNCRIGKKDNFKHCHTCGVCLPLQHFEKNKCISGISNSDCPICFENLNIYMNGFLPMDCGHMMHIECFTKYIQTNDKCPLCCKTIVHNKFKHLYTKFIVNTNPMPEEYRNKKVVIYCNDCEKKNEVNWNVIAMFCPECDSMNTKQF
jgi:RING finger/CHY zinc finger protein 1